MDMAVSIDMTDIRPQIKFIHFARGAPHVKPTESNDFLSFAITLYYPEHTKFSKVTCVKYQKAYFDAETKTLVIEVNPNGV